MNKLNIFPTAVMNENDRKRHEKFCDSFFYATGMIWCKWMRDINKWESNTHKEEDA